jgi:flavin reductase (DIM6/NTAB) family NADH-FMN oxidoreductase RutF
MKKQIGSVNCLYPLPTVLVGVMVNEKPNFITIAHVGILNDRPPHHISLSMGKVHYSNAGIKHNRTFSVNIPSENLMAQADYCGIVTGKTTDKTALFQIFYGELKTAPMIKECPVNMECKLAQIVDFPTHDIFIGEIMQTYAEEEVLTEGHADLSKVKPLLFDMSSKSYWNIGHPLGNCWKVGMELKKKMQK